LKNLAAGDVVVVAVEEEVEVEVLLAAVVVVVVVELTCSKPSETKTTMANISAADSSYQAISCLTS